MEKYHADRSISTLLVSATAEGKKSLPNFLSYYMVYYKMVSVPVGAGSPPVISVLDDAIAGRYDSRTQTDQAGHGTSDAPEVLYTRISWKFVKLRLSVRKDMIFLPLLGVSIPEIFLAIVQRTAS